MSCNPAAWQVTARASDFEGLVTAGRPIAGDAALGSPRWRLLDEVIHHQPGETQVALEWLLTQGCLPEESPASFHAISRSNPDRAGETQELERYAARGRAAQDSEMPSLTIDSMNNAALWSALAPDGVTPSTE